MSEQTLFDWLKENKYPDLKKSNNNKSRWDCVSESKELLIELKCRRTHYDTLIIEKGKYANLLVISDLLNYTPLYINSTPKGIYSFNLLDFEDIEFKEKSFPKTTDFSNKMWIGKFVAYLDISDAVKYNYVI